MFLSPGHGGISLTETEKVVEGSLTETSLPFLVLLNFPLLSLEFSSLVPPPLLVDQASSQFPSLTIAPR